mmetsp:Transcript_60344/g.168594  ORF Transcript_60344/g.168594 Transcript_60344/m.168594 type:complete len:556 (-) Transcript_60344:139-1806(-)
MSPVDMPRPASGYNQTQSAAERAGATWTAAAPSPSYNMTNEFETPYSAKPRPIPSDVKEDLQNWKKELIALHEEQGRSVKAKKEGPDKEVTDPYASIVVTDFATHHRVPENGMMVRMGYVVANKDGSILDHSADFEHTLGQAGPIASGHVIAAPLEYALKQMKRGQIASITCALEHLFLSESPIISQHGPDAEAVLEVKLLEVYSSKDVSFEKGAELVFKEVVKDGAGSWCDNPTDEGFVRLRFEELKVTSGVAGADAVETFLQPPSPQKWPITVDATPGNGELCDALEGAVLEMRNHETAIVTCKKAQLCKGGAPLTFLGPDASFGPDVREVSIRVTMLDYHKGPDVWQIGTENQVTFALRRKEHADRLLKGNRPFLAAERYRQILKIFSFMDRPRAIDRFLGKMDLYEECKKIRSACRSNLALSYLYSSESERCVSMCEIILQAEPENTKAFFRRAKAQMMRKDYTDAVHSIERLLDIDSSIDEARDLLKKAKALQKASEKRQNSTLKFGRMVRNLQDDRSIKYDYLEAEDLESPPPGEDIEIQGFPSAPDRE